MPHTAIAARYTTDNRDLPEEDQRDLIISIGANGDWYVAIAPTGGETTAEVVRLCTSGGASFRCPGLTIAIAEAYRAITASTRSNSCEVLPSYMDLEREVAVWRARAVKYVYDPRDDAIVLREH